jgi:signal transduction histidine kinase
MRVLEPKRKIEEDVAPDLGVHANRDSLKQTLVIVLDNAIRHTEGKIRVTAAKHGNAVEVRVNDEGRGISPGEIGHIFDRFYRAEENLKTPGFGLGLPIARSLMQGQNGNISIESEVGKGSTVIITLPASE